MGEKIGLIFSIFIVQCFIFPIMLQSYVIFTITDHFNKATTEITQMVKVNGGYTKNVEEKVSNLTLGGEALGKASALKVTVDDETVEEGRKSVGRQVTISYDYTYIGMYNKEYTFNTSSTVTINKR